jgi:Holliday junction resolvase RusA-like endonuclease
MITLATKPLTFNSAYPTNKFGRRFLTREGKEYKSIIARATIEHFYHLRNYKGTLTFMAEIHGPFLTKKGVPSKTAGDIDGFTKLLIDASCESLGIDDSLVWRIEFEKFHADDWFISYQIFPNPENFAA